MFQIQANNEINSAQPDAIGAECFAFHSQTHKPGRKYNPGTFLVAQHFKTLHIHCRSHRFNPQSKN